MSSLKTKIETFKNQLMTIDCKYSEKCSKLEYDIASDIWGLRESI